MKFIELHIDKEPLLLNVSLIESVKPSSYKGKAMIYMAGSSPSEFWITDESYETILDILQGRA